MNSFDVAELRMFLCTSSTIREFMPCMCHLRRSYFYWIFASTVTVCRCFRHRRIWGSNTHADLPAAAVALRKTVKERIVTSALRLKEGRTFQRGRQLGALEANIAHELRERKKSAKRAIEDARKSLRREKFEDWSHLSEKDLKRELLRRKVIGLKDSVGSGTEVEATFAYSKSFLSLCKKCVSSQESTKDVNTVAAPELDSIHLTNSKVEINGKERTA